MTTKQTSELEIERRLQEARDVVLALVPETGRMLVEDAIDRSQLGKRAWPAVSWLVANGLVQYEREQFYTYLRRPNGSQPRRSKEAPAPRALPVAVEPLEDDLEERF